MKKPKIAILTSLSDFSPAYSLTGIILNQCKMFERNGYDYTLFCQKSFNAQDKVRGPKNVQYVLNSTELIDYQPYQRADPKFEEDVKKHYEGYVKALKDYDIVITHDLMFVSWFLVQNQAIRMCVEEWPEKHWLHWCHSAPSGPMPQEPSFPSTLRFQGCDNSTYVYLNHRQRQDLANHLQIDVDNISVVYNPKDPRDEWSFDDKTCQLIEFGDLLDHEILQVYPFSTPRWTAKGVKQLLKVWGYWKRTGIKAKLVLVNAHCTQEQDEAEVRNIESYARKNGLSVPHDVIITSRFAATKEIEDQANSKEWDSWKYSVPYSVVQNLMQISNVFLFPSLSECCSLIQAEAAISGKFMVLNRNFLPMLEFARDNVIGYDFHNNPDSNPGYYECLARELWGIIQKDPTCLNAAEARCKYYNRDWIFRNQLEPLLYRGLVVA